MRPEHYLEGFVPYEDQVISKYRDIGAWRDLTYGDLLGPDPVGHFLQPSVASYPGSLLFGQFLASSQSPDINGLDMRRQGERTSQLLDEFSILSGSFPAQQVVEVGDLECDLVFFTQVREQMKQGGGIRPSGYRYQNDLPGSYHLVSADGSSYFFLDG